MKTCSSIAAILHPSSSGIWRQRFRALYDPPHGRTSEEIKVGYQIRSLVLRQNFPFRYGEGPKQELWLEVVKTLLIGMKKSIGMSCIHKSREGKQEMDHGKTSIVKTMLTLLTESLIRPHETQAGDTSASKNLERLIDIFPDSDFMNRPVVGYEQGSLRVPSDSFAAVQLCLTHLAISPEMGYRALRTDYDMAVVYKYGLPTSQIFVPGKVYLRSLLHIRNFWKRHLTNPDEATFYHTFKKLSPGRRPQAWAPDLSTNTDLGTHWLGYYCKTSPSFNYRNLR